MERYTTSLSTFLSILVERKLWQQQARMELSFIVRILNPNLNFLDKYHPWVNANILLEKYHIGFLKK